MNADVAATGSPLPRITERNRPFWDAARLHELRLQRCRECDHLRYPIAPVCPRCLSARAEWVKLSGRGEVFARVVYWRAFGAAFADAVPYVVALVQLDEGPRMLSDIVRSAPEDVFVGSHVEVVFDDISEDVTVPRFRLAKAVS